MKSRRILRPISASRKYLDAHKHAKITIPQLQILAKNFAAQCTGNPLHTLLPTKATDLN